MIMVISLFLGPLLMISLHLSVLGGLIFITLDVFQIKFYLKSFYGLAMLYIQV